MKYRCARCGWGRRAHEIVRLSWLQLDLFNNPFMHRKGYRIKLVDCEEYQESRAETRERAQVINHSVPCIVFYANGLSTLIDIGS